MTLQTQQYLSSKIFKDVEYEISAGRLIYMKVTQDLYVVLYEIYILCQMYTNQSLQMCAQGAS